MIARTDEPNGKIVVLLKMFYRYLYRCSPDYEAIATSHVTSIR
jgi:hypothetical protein